MILAWSNERKKKIIGAVIQRPRGKVLRLNGIEIMRARARSLGYHQYQGWFWYGGHKSLGVNIPTQNTCFDPVDTLEKAMEDCEAYVRACLEATKKKGTMQ